jgi:pimeloyl-ACP methyl ester carboxylesterase
MVDCIVGGMKVDLPEIHYTQSGDTSIAYQVLGAGPVDVVFVPFLSNLVWAWEQPIFASFCRRLASFSRLILFDKRGTGLSDRPRELPTLEERMDDIRAVLDAVDSKVATLIGASSAGGQLCALFAATYPARTAALVLHDTEARVVSAPEYPGGKPLERWQARLEEAAEGWGSRAYQRAELRRVFPSRADDQEFEAWYVTNERLAASPGAAVFFLRALVETDVRDILPAIRVPTLVLYHQALRAECLWLAERIPDARAVEMPGADLSIYADDAAANAIEEFTTGRRAVPVPDRVLTTLVFTDIVGSTETAAGLGDRRWSALLTRHHAVIRAQLARFGGSEVRATGDGFFATFDGPARGVLFGLAAITEAAAIGLAIRVGVHTGEVERVGGGLEGIAIHVAARVAAEASGGEVLTTTVVKDLVAGSGIEFEERESRVLKGVPGEWRLLVASAPTSEDVR